MAIISTLSKKEGKIYDDIAKSMLALFDLKWDKRANILFRLKLMNVFSDAMRNATERHIESINEMEE